MTLSLTWLNDYLTHQLTVDQMSEALTSLGLEVEKTETFESVKGGLKGVVAGKVLTCQRHPDADRLSVTTVDVGTDTIHHIVCGANNIAAGQTVWVALPGTTLYAPDGKSWTIQVSKIRGQISEGMICAEDELGLGTNHDGIIVLPDDVEAGTLASTYYFVTTDTLFEIGLTPNRSDATSVIGVASDLAALLSVQTDVFHPVILPTIPEWKVEGLPSYEVEVKRLDACPRYSGIRIDELKIAPSPEWIQQRLRAIGVKTINNVVDITNFVLHELGQPLHAFDATKIAGNRIIVETKPAGTEFLALDQQVYKLDAEDLMICDGNGAPMCIGGVYGGFNSGVTDSTTSVFLEAAHFHPTWIRRSSMRHNLRTDAAKRFEKGSDPNITLTALQRAAQLLAEYAGGKIVSAPVDIYPSQILPAHIDLHLDTLRSKTGVAFSKEKTEQILDALQMSYVPQGVDTWTVKVPTNKSDVIREIDLVEEILRVYGFIHVQLPAKMQTSVAIESRHTLYRLRRMLGDHLAAMGYLEAMNMSLTQPSYYAGAVWSDPSNWVTIHNTSNESVNLMRPDMIIPMLETVRRNINRKQQNIRLFEFGKTYHQQNGAPSEREYLVLVLTGLSEATSWKRKDESVDYFSIKEITLSVVRRLGIEVDRFETISHINGLQFGVSLSNSQFQFGRLGAVDGALLADFDIDQPVYFAELDLNMILHLSTHTQVIFQELNRFPSVVRDLAMILEDRISYAEVEHVCRKAGGEWLTDIEVFDIYKNDEHVGVGKKSMALRFTMEKKEATLTDKEIQNWFEGIQKSLTKELNVAIRK